MTLAPYNDNKMCARITESVLIAINVTFSNDAILMAFCAFVTAPAPELCLFPEGY